MKLHAMLLIAALSLSPAALAQQADTAGPQPSAKSGETSDRTPEQAAPTPQNQQDTAGDKTSDRSPDKDVKVEHQPGAAGTAGSSSEGAASGASGSSAPANPESK